MMPTASEKELFSRALELKESGKLLESLSILKDLSRALDTAALFATMGHIHWELGELTEAAQQFRKAIALAPTSKTASLALFHCLWERGQKIEALEEAKRFTAKTKSKEYMDIVKEINQGKLS